MKKLNCIIVDDEPLAQDLIEKYILKVPQLTLKAKYDNAIEAVEDFHNEHIDVIFLDVNMPEMSGIEMISCISERKPFIIITTAHPDYAVKGFELDVTDYLLKPFGFSRFMKAINRVYERMSLLKNNNPLISSSNISFTAGLDPERENATLVNENFFLIKADKKLIKVNVEEIVFVEGMKDYVKIHLQNKFIIAHLTMTKILNILPASLFIRINRSFIIHIQRIKSIEGNFIETTNDHKLTIGIMYREIVRNRLKSWTIQ